MVLLADLNGWTPDGVYVSSSGYGEGEGVPCLRSVILKWRAKGKEEVEVDRIAAT